MVQVHESWKADQLNYLPDLDLDLDLPHPNVYRFCDLLKHVKGLILQFQGCQSSQNRAETGFLSRIPVKLTMVGILQ